MKKITLLLALVSLGVQAQTFPAPYCDVDNTGVTVEEITTVDFAEVSITNTDTSSVLIDATDSFGFGNIGDTYTLTVGGNTVGDFDNNIVAFIDWNNNEILDDDGEVYEIGTITNSTGEDGITVSMDITIPVDAEAQELRVRITKTYTDADSPAEIDPCAIVFDPFGQGTNPGYGQALDFTLLAGLVGVDKFDTNAFTVYPSPVSDILNVEYKTAISSLKVYNLLGQEVYSQNNSGNQLQANLSTLQRGAYIVKVKAQEGEHSFKVIKE